MREPRFPGIDWYCDNCGSCLSDQKGFDDHKYVWKCRECGFKNSISIDNISTGDSKSTKMLMYILGFLSYIGLWTAIMLGISILLLNADRAIYWIPFLGSIGLYLFAAVLAVVVDFSIRHHTFSIKNLLFVIFRNLKEDLLSPFLFLKELISNLLSFLTHLLPIKRKYEWHSNKFIIIMAIIYTLITALELVAFSRINGFTLTTWGDLFNSAFIWMKNFLHITK